MKVHQVAEKILATYSNQNPRTLYIHKSYCNYSKLGCVFFAIDGSPPKGYAIYMPDYHYLIVIDAWGHKRIYKDITVTDLDKFQDTDKFPMPKNRG